MKNIIKFINSLLSISIIPFVMLFGVALSGIGIKFYFILVLILLEIGASISKLKKMIYPPGIMKYMTFLFSWAAFLLFVLNRGEDGLYHLIILFFSFLIVFGMSNYGKSKGVDKFNKFLFFYLVIVFIIAIFEIKFGLVLPMSAKADLNKDYAILFRGVPTGFFYNSNDFASAIIIILSFSYTYLAILKRKSKWFVVIISILLLIFTASRGALVLLLLLPIVKRAVNKEKLVFIIVLMIIFVLLFGGIILYNLDRFALGSRFVSRIERGLKIFQGGGDSSFLTRFLIIKYTLDNFSDLVIGYGPGGSKIFLANSNPFNIINPHNLLLEILINYGFIGISLTIVIYYKSIKYLKNMINNSKYLNTIAAAKGALVTIYLFPFISIISSSLLKDWSFAWFPLSLVFLIYGAYSKELEQDEIFGSNCKL